MKWELGNYYRLVCVCVRNNRRLVKKMSLSAPLKMFGGHEGRIWRLAEELLL